MKRIIALLLLVVLLVALALPVFAAPNMEPNGNGNGHKKQKECTAHNEPSWQGSGWGHVKFGCEPMEEPD